MRIKSMCYFARNILCLCLPEAAASPNSSLMWIKSIILILMDYLLPVLYNAALFAAISTFFKCHVTYLIRATGSGEAILPSSSFIFSSTGFKTNANRQLWLLFCKTRDKRSAGCPLLSSPPDYCSEVSVSLQTQFPTNVTLDCRCSCDVNAI